MAEDFLTLERACVELELDADELRRLVSEGEIRAFRDAGSMKFRRSDVDAFKRARGGAAVTEEEYPTEEIASGGEGVAFEAAGEPGMVTEEISVEEESAPAPAPSVGTETASRTRRPVAAAGRRAVAGRARPGVRGASRAGEASAAAEEEGETEPAWFRGVLIATSMILFVGALIAFSSARSRETGLTRPISALFRGQG